MSPCSSSWACGMISLSTKVLTLDRISRSMSVRSAVCAKRVNALLLRDSGVRVTGEYGPPGPALHRVPARSGRATRPDDSRAPRTALPADRGGVPPDRRPLDGEDP